MKGYKVLAIIHSGIALILCCDIFVGHSIAIDAIVVLSVLGCALLFGPKRHDVRAALSEVKPLSGRVRGTVTLATGLLLARLQIYDPLHARELGIKTVWVGTAFVGFAVLFTPFGLLHIALGDRLDEALVGFKMNPANLNWRDIVLLVLFAIPVGITWFWVMNQLREQGYG